MSDDTIFDRPPPTTTPRDRSPRTRLWTELEQLHKALDMPAPTETLTNEELLARVEQLRAQHDHQQKPKA